MHMHSQTKINKHGKKHSILSQNAVLIVYGHADLQGKGLSLVIHKQADEVHIHK